MLEQPPSTPSPSFPGSPSGTAAHDDWDRHWTEYAGCTSRNPAQAMRHALTVELIQRERVGTGGLRILDIGSGFLPVDDEKPLLASPAVVLAWFEPTGSGRRVATFYELSDMLCHLATLCERGLRRGDSVPGRQPESRRIGTEQGWSALRHTNTELIHRWLVASTPATEQKRLRPNL